MKSFASLAVLLSMAYTATAVAIPEVEAVTDVALAKRQDNGAWCGKRVNGDYSYYEITTWGVWDDDWGSGLLDNLRGECGKWGNIEDWGFNYDAGAPPTDGHAHFNAGASARDTNCVENAIWDASNPTGAIWGVTCQWF